MSVCAPVEVQIVLDRDFRCLHVFGTLEVSDAVYPFLISTLKAPKLFPAS